MHLLTQKLLSILSMWPNQRSLLFWTHLPILSRFNLPLSSSDRRLSLWLTLHIHRIIRISFLSMQHIKCSALNGQVITPRFLQGLIKYYIWEKLKHVLALLLQCSRTSFYTVERDTLDGYYSACCGLLGRPSDPTLLSDPQLGPLDMKIEKCRDTGYKVRLLFIM